MSNALELSDVPAIATPEPSPSIGERIGFGLSAANWDQGFRIAKTLAVSALVPKGYFGHPEDIVVAMQMGAEIGLPPMAALQSIAVINGRPGLYGDGLLGVIMASPYYVRHVEYYVTSDGEIVDGLRASDLLIDETRAVAKFWRRGIAEPFTAEFSIGDAKRAKLLTKAGPWSEFTARMLRWRARGYAARDGFAAELRGIKLAHEIDDLPIDDLPPREPDRPIVEPIRRSQKVSAAGDSLTAPTPAPAPLPSAAGPLLTSELPPPKTATAPKAKPPAADGDIVTTDHLIIIDTQYVTPKDHEPYYEIRARVEKPGTAPIAYIFLTQNKDWYDLAQSAEGSAAPFAITWHRIKRRDGSDGKAIDRIVAG